MVKEITKYNPNSTQVDITDKLSIYHELGEFATRVFNYYNGRVNIVNTPAVLLLHTDSPYSKFLGGLALNPNYVICYLDAYPDTDMIYMKSRIYECIIHELFHLDQQKSAFYQQDVVEDANEPPVYFQTGLYLATHQNEAKMFGVNLEYCTQYIAFINKEYLNQDYAYLYYHRVDYPIHIVNTLGVTPEKEEWDEDDGPMTIRLLKYIYEAFNTPGACLTMCLNGDLHILKYSDGHVMPISYFNIVASDFKGRYGLYGISIDKYWISIHDVEGVYYRFDIFSVVSNILGEPEEDI